MARCTVSSTQEVLSKRPTGTATPWVKQRQCDAGGLQGLLRGPGVSPLAGGWAALGCSRLWDRCSWLSWELAPPHLCPVRGQEIDKSVPGQCGDVWKEPVRFDQNPETGCHAEAVKAVCVVHQHACPHRTAARLRSPLSPLIWACLQVSPSPSEPTKAALGVREEGRAEDSKVLVFCCCCCHPSRPPT